MNYERNKKHENSEKHSKCCYDQGLHPRKTRAGRLKETLRDESGQFVVDHAVVFVIIIVLGALALAALKVFVTNDMAPTLKNKIMEFFN